MKSLVFFFVATLSVCWAADRFRYKVKLPYYNTTVPTEVEIVVRDRRERVKLEIDDVDKKSAGGDTYLDFDKKLLVVQTRNKRNCYIISFPNIAFHEAKSKLKLAPTPDGLLKSVYCKIENVPRPFSGIPEKVNDICKLNRSNTLVKRVSDCKISENAKFCLVSGFVDDGLACIAGENTSEV